MAELPAFDRGVVLGVLIGEGHFGGDGKQPQVTLRMHVRHEALFRWLVRRFPRSRLYGPYPHRGRPPPPPRFDAPPPPATRHYFQWMVRGRALVEDLLPVLEAELDPALDAY